MLRLFTLLVFTVGTLNANAVAQSRCELLFQNDQHGETLQGEKASLITAVESGAPIRVGWHLDANGDGELDLLHWADASFLTVWNGEVFTQISNIHIQTPRLTEGDVVFLDRDIQWRGMIDTTGLVQNAFTGGMRVPGETRGVITWCAVN